MVKRNAKKKSAPKPARRQKPKPRPMRQGLEQMRLSMCEQSYLRAQVDPFSPEILGEVCYPAFPSKRSMKYAMTTSVSVGIGTNGWGWVLCDPTPVTATAAVFYTGTDYPGGSTSPFLAGGPGTGSVGLNGNVTSSMLSNSSALAYSNQARVVVAGIRHRYTGTELNRGGVVRFVVSPDQRSLGNTTIDESIGLTTARLLPCTSRPISNTVPPAHVEDLTWVNSNTLFPWSKSSFGEPSTNAPNPFFGLVFQGQPGNTFLVEFIVHCEVAGASYNSSAHSSHVGDQRVIQSTMEAAATATYGMPDSGKSWSESFAEALRSVSDNPMSRAAASYASNLAVGVTKLYAKRMLYGDGSGHQSLEL